MSPEPLPPTAPLASSTPQASSPRRRRVLGSTRSRLLVLAAVVAVGVAWPDSGASQEPSAANSAIPAAADSSTTPEATPEATETAAPATAPPTSQTTPSAPNTVAPAMPPAKNALPTASGTATTTRPGTAITTLATLAVKGRAARTGYSRDLFGQTWADVDRNGCDTRNDILRRDLTADVLKAGTNGCLVLRGTLRDPYTGKSIGFVRGPSTSSRVQVDHVVPLSDAWQKGGQRLSPQKRTAFANDPLNLLAVDGPSNLRKGDGDAATWLPPSKAYRCRYVARQVAVKRRYGLWVTAAERDAIVRVLRSCPGQALPKAGAIPLGGGRTESPPSPSATTAAPAPLVPPHEAGTDPRFDTCRAATGAGYGPYVSGRDPEYDWYRDADSDGTVCE